MKPPANHHWVCHPFDTATIGVGYFWIGIVFVINIFVWVYHHGFVLFWLIGIWVSVGKHWLPINMNFGHFWHSGSHRGPGSMVCLDPVS